MNFGNLSDLIGIATPQLLRKSWGTKAFHWMRKFRLIVIAVKSDHLSEPTFIDSDIFTWIAKNTPSLTPSPDSMEYIVMSWTLTGEPKSTVRK